MSSGFSSICFANVKPFFNGLNNIFSYKQCPSIWNGLLLKGTILNDQIIEILLHERSGANSQTLQAYCFKTDCESCRQKKERYKEKGINYTYFSW